MDQNEDVLDWDRDKHGRMAEQVDPPGLELEVDTDDDKGV